MIFVTSGFKGSGKTTFQYQIAGQLQQEGIQVRGFLAFHDFQRDSYSIYNIQTHEALQLAQRLPASEKSGGPFQFQTNSVKQGKTWIHNILKENPDLAVIDEIGIYELNGKVWCDAFTRLCNSSVPLLFSTNSQCLPQILKEWELIPSLIFYPEDFQRPKQAAAQIRNHLQY